MRICHIIVAGQTTFTSLIESNMDLLNTDEFEDWWESGKSRRSGLARMP